MLDVGVQKNRIEQDLYLRKLALGEIDGEKTGFASIDKPWLKYYSEEVIKAELPECTMYEFLRNNNANNQNDKAIIYFGKKITYVIAVVSRFEERSIPTRIYVKGSPSSYIVFENIDIPSEAVGEQAEVTGVFEYETSYLDKDGNICLWLDTDEIYYGNEPPADTENSRWVIMGYEDGEYEERRFRRQIKQ